MSIITINTHKAFKILVDSGVPEKQAEGHLKVLEKMDLTGTASKKDIESVKIEMNHLEYKLKIWMLGGFLTQFIAITALLFQFFK